MSVNLIALSDIIREMLYRQNEVLRIATEPFLITNDTLCSCYMSLQEAAQNYSSITPEQKPQFREDNCYSLKIVEFQAGWHVLKVTNHANTNIFKMSEDTRNNLFLCELYTYSELFPFFQPRETAITALDGIGFIDAGNYRWIV